MKEQYVEAVKWCEKYQHPYWHALAQEVWLDGAKQYSKHLSRA